MLMGVPLVRMLAKHWHHTGLGHCSGKIVSVLAVIVEMVQRAGMDFEDKTVVELGPGQTPDLLFGALAFGARKAVGLDVERYLNSGTREIGNFEKSYNRIRGAVDCGRLPGNLSLRENRFRHAGVVPQDCFDVRLYDGKRFPLDDESVDIIWSRSVLEHVKDYRDVLREMERVLKPGGISCHIIDLRDHTTFENGKDWLRFLKYTNAQWNLMTGHRTTWSNRVRASQWEKAFQEGGLCLIDKRVVVLPFHEDFDRGKLSASFCRMEDEDLKVGWVSIAVRKERTVEEGCEQQRPGLKKN
jgi:SAM-dependent methyltransferase